MPTYEYECQTCGHQFEMVQSMKDPHLTACPKAGCPGPVRRKIGRGAGIIFKGSGFYQTDYRSESYKEAAKKDSQPAAAPPPSTTTPSTPAAPASGSGSSAASSSGSTSSSSSGSTSSSPKTA
jgi:putative FmdB family regulatory protein